MANLTIVVDDTLLKQARMRALDEGSSVNAVLREFLQRYASAQDRAAHDRSILEGVLALAQESPGDSRGANFDRDSIYAERMTWPR